MPICRRSAIYAAAAFVLSVGLNACSSTGGSDSSASPFPALPPPAMAEPAASCDQSKASWAIGQQADEALMKKIIDDTGAKHARKLRPGMMVTMEFDGTRVNVRVDNNDKVLSVTCG